MPHLYRIVYLLLLQFAYFYIKLINSFEKSPAAIARLNNIEYIFYDYQVVWEEANIICSGYESELATLDTVEKAFFIAQRTAESSYVDEEFWVGSKTHSRGFWFWISSNTKLLPNEYFEETISLPHYGNKSFITDDYCLTIFRKNHSVPVFSPLHCQEKRSFICQRDEPAPGKNNEHAFTLKIENKDFILFAMKLTWLESVVYCRQRRLQIAEISSTREANILAMKMIKIRPKSIENAWIGGHLKNRIWQWLPTGNNISINHMWNDEYMFNGNCLLLDRHVDQLPMYVSAKCKQKRNFFCQTPMEKDIISEPVVVFVDSCEYWIGFKPKKWLDASETCKNLSKRLVVLDSIITLNHITTLMIDNRRKLQHLWIDGKIQRNTNGATWKWDSTGEKIPSVKNSFIPWYKDSQLYERNSDCLNMDRENFDVPIVYGLDCNLEQSFICQQKSLNCDRMKNMNILDATYTTLQPDLKILTKVNLKNKLKPNNGSNYEHQNKKIEDQPLTTKINTRKKINTTEINFQPKPDLTNSAILDNFDISARMSLDDFAKKKTLNNTINDKKAANTPILGFKDIIELISKNLIENKNLSNFLLSNVDRNTSIVLSEKLKMIKDNNIDKTLEVLLNDHISKMIESNMNKNSKLSSTVVYPIRKFLNNTSLVRNSLSKNVDLAKAIRNKLKNSGHPEIQSNSEKNMFYISEIMKSIFNFQNSSSNVRDSHSNDEDKNTTLKPSTIASRESVKRRGTKTASIIKNKQSTRRKITHSENSIQTVSNFQNKDENILNVNDIVNTVIDHLKKNNNSISLAIMDHMTSGKKKFVSKPWNEILHRVFQSLNNTKIKVNRKTVRFHVENFS